MPPDNILFDQPAVPVEKHEGRDAAYTVHIRQMRLDGILTEGQCVETHVAVVLIEFRFGAIAGHEDNGCVRPGLGTLEV